MRRSGPSPEHPAGDDSSRPSVRRTRYAATCPDEAHAFLDRAYGARLRAGGAHDRSWRITLDQLDARLVTSSDLNLQADVTVDVAAQDQYVFTVMLAGRAEFDRGGPPERIGAGAVYLAADPCSHSVGNADHAHVRTVALPASVLDEVAGAPVRFLSRTPSPGGADRWIRSARHVDDLLRDVADAAAPLVVGPAARLLAATALAVFPNTAVEETGIRDRRDAHPETLRRAIAHIETHLELDLSLADIARAAYVTPRALQLAFRRHLDTTPMAYLRRLRLDRARVELAAGAPGDGRTVTDIATRWGFSPNRFSRLYRATYGHAPSQDLRR